MSEAGKAAGAAKREAKEEKEKEKEVEPLDADDIALLKSYGLGPYSTRIKALGEEAVFRARSSAPAR
jgi:NACalpha-BTF3-like transcription factor